MKFAILIFVSMAFLVSGAHAFDYTYVKTVPMPHGDTMIDLADACGVIPQMIIPVSDYDFRGYPCSDLRYIVLGDETALITTSLSAALQDSFFDLAHPIPSEGEVFYGRFPWFFKPASLDTVWIRCYKFAR